MEWSNDATSKIAFQSVVLSSLKEHSPIKIRVPNPLGDTFLYAGAVHYVLEAFCKQHGIPTYNINIDPRKRSDLQYGEFNLTTALEQITGPILTYSNPHIFTAFKEQLSDALAAALPNDHVQKVVFPVKTTMEPFSAYDKTTVIDKGERNYKYYRKSGKHIFLLIQSGSKDVKRFNDEQIGQIVAAVRESHPNHAIIVLTDRDFSYRTVQCINTGEQPSYAKNVDKVMSTGDINERLALAYAADCIATTDSFSAHVAAAGKALHSSRNGVLQPGDMLILDTVAPHERYGIANAAIVESQALLHWRKHGPKTSFMPLTIGLDRYRKFYAEKLNISPDSIHEIAQEDIDEFIREIQKIGSIHADHNAFNRN